MQTNKWWYRESIFNKFVFYSLQKVPQVDYITEGILEEWQPIFEQHISGIVHELTGFCMLQIFTGRYLQTD